MLPNANDLESFLELCRTGNMSRAAERLGVTQPALSQGLKRLEQSIGEQLMIRTKGGLVLTRAGMRLQAGAQDLVSRFENLRSQALEDHQLLKGRYTLGIHPSVALYTLPYMMPALLKKFPGLELQLHHDLSRNITEQVISFKLDFGLVINPVQHPDLVLKEVVKDQVHYVRSKKKTIHNDIDGELTTLICDPGLLQTQGLLQKNKRKNNFARTIESSNLEVIKSLVLAGAGVGILPMRVIDRDVKEVEVLDEFPSFKDRLYLAYRVDAQTGSAKRELMTTFRELLEKALL